ncbi:hypothetical protein B0H10DRAFT_2210138 [Mycena sp. CBHHK59/15]|nr:hypothetical protein B0H10DRAFT_2210138 [Mycena sp. CBHHK59/15]
MRRRRVSGLDASHSSPPLSAPIIGCRNALGRLTSPGKARSGPTSLRNIDVWITIKSNSVLDTFKPPSAAMTVNVWNRKKGDPKASAPGAHPFKGKFPAGTFQTKGMYAVSHMFLCNTFLNRLGIAEPGPHPYASVILCGHGGQLLGQYQVTVGVNLVREALCATDEEFDMEFQYLPLCNPLPRVKTYFPYIPTREDSLQSGGGMRVEILLSTDCFMLEFSLLLWSANLLALEALGQPGTIDVGFYKSDVFALNVMTPQTSSRKNRYLSKLATRRMWRTDDGPAATGNGAASVAGNVGVAPVKGAPSSRMQESAALQLSDESKEAPPNDDGTERAPSPTPSLKDIALNDAPETDHFARLDGAVRVPACSHPSFRYPNMGREYVMRLLIQHPQYAHISPNATGLLAEFPVWTSSTGSRTSRRVQRARRRATSLRCWSAAPQFRWVRMPFERWAVY